MPKWHVVPDPRLTFDEYNAMWHAEVIANGPPGKDSMYWDGQFDEFPYVEWENHGGTVN